MAFSKVIFNGTTLMDVTSDTVAANNLLDGYTATGADGEAVAGAYVAPTFSTQAKTGINPTTSSQTITPDAGYDGLSSVQINAMPSGTAGTPTAAKSAVNNHAVTVTPSVTNTTGYITGGTINGTAVSVSAAELVSGTQEITSNSTYDVTTLASVLVNVPPAGFGSAYEEGSYSPVSDVVDATVTFANQHSNPPSLVLMIDAGGYTSTLNTNHMFFLAELNSLLGGVVYNSSTQARAGICYYWARTTSSTSITANAYQVNYGMDDPGSSGTAYYRYWATETGFKANTNSTSRYWRTGRTYKWFAIWA